MKIESAEEAFQIVKEIDALYIDLLAALEKLGKDESISTRARHLCIKQICGYNDEYRKRVEAYADDYLENKVEKVAKERVPGFTLGESERDALCVAGMEYNYRPVHKVEILNKDDRSWNQLLKLLVDAGFGHAVQKRLNVKVFLENEEAMKAAQGLLGFSTDGAWSITKPKEPKTLRHVGKAKGEL